jgi:hypothetical protein
MGCNLCAAATDLSQHLSADAHGLSLPSSLRPEEEGEARSSPARALKCDIERGHVRRRPQVRRDTRAHRDAGPRPFHFYDPLTYCFD